LSDRYVIALAARSDVKRSSATGTAAPEDVMLWFDACGALPLADEITIGLVLEALVVRRKPGQRNYFG
jgi:hypothetical protein